MATSWRSSYRYHAALAAACGRPSQPAEAPPPDTSAGARGAFAPVRVIESTQTEDGAVIYELFREDHPEAPAMEVRVAAGAATVLTESNPH